MRLEAVEEAWIEGTVRKKELEFLVALRPWFDLDLLGRKKVHLEAAEQAQTEAAADLRVPGHVDAMAIDSRIAAVEARVAAA